MRTGHARTRGRKRFPPKPDGGKHEGGQASG